MGLLADLRQQRNNKTVGKHLVHSFLNLTSHKSGRTSSWKGKDESKCCEVLCLWICVWCGGRNCLNFCIAQEVKQIWSLCKHIIVTVVEFFSSVFFSCVFSWDSTLLKTLGTQMCDCMPSTWKSLCRSHCRWRCASLCHLRRKTDQSYPRKQTAKSI